MEGHVADKWVNEYAVLSSWHLCRVDLSVDKMFFTYGSHASAPYCDMTESLNGGITTGDANSHAGFIIGVIACDKWFIALEAAEMNETQMTIIINALVRFMSWHKLRLLVF